MTRLLLPSAPPITTEYAALRDGTPVTVRVVSPADRPRIAALFARMSPLSLRHRFFGVKRELTAGELDFLLGDGTDHVVLAVVTGSGDGEVVRGLGRYVVLADHPDVAEVAFEVGDADQGHGIATLLLARIARIARDRGVRELRAEVEADNTAMLGVFEHSQLAVHEVCSRGIYSVEMPTAPRTAPRLQVGA
jgi:acetyltransferase